MSTPSENEALAKAIHHLAQVHDKQLGAVAGAIDRLATQIKSMGSGETITQMGAIEYLGTTVEKAGEDIASSLRAIADRE